MDWRHIALTYPPQTYRRSTRCSKRPRYDEAAATAREQLHAQPRAPSLWRGLGIALRHSGDEVGAAAALLSALEYGIEDPLPVHVALAEIDFRAKRRAPATARLTQVLATYRAKGAQLGANDLAGAAQAARLLARDDSSLFKAALNIYELAIERAPDSVRLRVELGDLLLEKYNNEEARELYKEALRLDPNEPDALLAMARSELFDESPDAAEFATKVVERLPKRVDARVLLARILLNTHDFDAAKIHVDAALAVNPRSTEALTVQAIAALLMADTDILAASIEHIRAIAPGDAQVFTALAEAAVRNRLYPEAVEFAVSAIAVDDKAWRAHGILGLNRLRLGQIEDGRNALEHAFEGDPYNIWVKNTLDLLDRMNHFEISRSARFELVADPKEASVLAAYLLPLAEQAYDYYAKRYGHRPATPIRLEVFPKHEDFSVRTVGLVGVDILGAAFGPVITMDSPSTRAFGPVNWASVLWHEISHSFHLSMSAQRVPRWFTEGLAVLEEHHAQPGWGGRCVARVLDRVSQRKTATSEYAGAKLSASRDIRRGHQLVLSKLSIVGLY